MPTAIQDLILLNPGGGGANEKVKPTSIRENQSAAPGDGTLPLKNCHTNTIGSILKRKGFTKYSGQLSVSGSPTTAIEEITGIFQYRKFDGTQFEIACGSSGGVEAIFDISSPATPVEIQGAISITDDTLFSFATLNDNLMMTTKDRDGLFKWTGSGSVTEVTGSPAPPAGKYIIEFENYMFIANTLASPERVFFSALGDPESYLAIDFLRLNGEITGMAKSGNSLFVFTLNSITVVRFTGDAVAPFSQEKLDTRVGCQSHHSIINIDGVLYWMGHDGHVWRMEGLTPRRVTEATPVTIKRLNGTVLSKCVAADHRELRQAWFCCSLDTATQNDFVIAFDYLNEEIFFYDGIDANYIENLTDSSGEIQTYFGDRDGYIYLTNNGNTDNPSEVETAMDMFRWTKQFDLGSASLVKRIRKARLSVNNNGSGNVFLEMRGDFGGAGGEILTFSQNFGIGDLLGTTFILGTSTLGDVKAIASFDVDTCLTAKFIQMKVYSGVDQLGVPVEIRSLALDYQVLRRR